MHTLTAVLIANRGEVASRVIRTARSMGIRTVSISSDVDQELAFVAEADESVGLGGSTATQSYLDIEKVISAAQATDVDAVHPGYGFLAESPEFAEACEAAGLKLVGPSASSMRSMGHKTTAKGIASVAGVPVLPGKILDGDELSAETLRAAGEEVGYPLLVKASAGGGGRGMRHVAQADDLASAVESAGREAKSSFGDGSVFLERYLEAARHVEVQIVADSYGTVLHLGDRDCSLQRRHQKVIEEAPAPGISEDLRSRMASAACSLATEIAYEGVGTVEFMVQGEDFYFLEMNTRLQVEHPVTEEVTGLDLVELQIRIASGARLDLTQEAVVLSGHAIEARLYAEDPRKDFLPASGRVSRFEWTNHDEIRIEQTYFAGDQISGFYDPLIAKVVVHAESRAQSRALISRELRQLQFHGPISNR
ncbi:MAG: acetyl/propionyl/methylcrotonyl-CoA carboxylase subunit alpha, partial [Acidimicrobiales bacterium]